MKTGLILLFVISALLPALAQNTLDEIAIKYLSERCADGNERMIYITLDDSVIHDVTQTSDKESVFPDESAIRDLCSRGVNLIAYHSHTQDDPFGEYPSSDDFWTVFQTTYLCQLEAAERGIIPTHVEHRLVHIDGANTVVQYDINSRLQDIACSLAQKIAQTADVTDLGSLPQAAKTIFDVHNQLREIREQIEVDFWQALTNYILDTCPDIELADDLRNCKISVAGFAASLDPCGDYFIAPPGADARVKCLPVTGQRINIGSPRYAGWTELTPANYDSFTMQKSVVIAFCSETRIGGNVRSWAILLAELDKSLPNCGVLKRGYVDIDRYPLLQQKHASGWPQVILVQYGRRYKLNVKNLSEQMFKLILCGPESLFKIPSY